MWVMTTDGFFSAVQHTDKPDSVLVRTRSEVDAVNLCVWLNQRGQMAGLMRTPNADYGWRVLVKRTVWGEYLAEAARRIDYPNFKDAVAVRQGKRRASVYAEVWATLYALQRDG